MSKKVLSNNQMLLKTCVEQEFSETTTYTNTNDYFEFFSATQILKNYNLSVGRIGKLECDFITRKNTEYQYLQVAMTIMDEKTEEREYKPYKYIRDNYPKYLFTMDPLLQKRDGIMHKNIVDFMAENQELQL